MANLDLLVLVGADQKRRPSSAQTIDFTAVRIGADTLPIVQFGSGGSAGFDLAARAIRSTFVPAPRAHGTGPERIHL